MRRTVEGTLNALLDEEASELVGPERYARALREDGGPGGLPQRPLRQKARHRGRGGRAQRAETPRRDLPDGRHRALPQARDLGRGAHRRDVPGGRLHQEDRGRLRAPLGAPVSSGTVSDLNERPFASIESWRQRPLEGGYPHVFVGGIYPKRGWGGSCESVAVLVAIGVNSAGDREVIGCSEGHAESAESRREFFSWLRGRGLSGVRLVTGDKCAGMLGALEEVFPGARHRRCAVHFYRNVPGRVPMTRRKAVARMLEAIHAQESREACGRKAEEVAGELESMRLGAAARTVRDGFAETLAYTAFPPER